MGFTDIFRRKKNKPQADPLQDLVLSKLRAGYFVDYDLKTWEVTRHHLYDWGDGLQTDEWELKSGSETCYLDREEDDEVEWSLSHRIPFKKLDSDGAIARTIKKTEDPPEEIQYEGRTYYLEQSGGGYFLRDGKGMGTEFLCWDFESEGEDQFITIEQWGENDFTALAGIFVEEYQLTNILPGTADHEIPER